VNNKYLLQQIHLYMILKYLLSADNKYFYTTLRLNNKNILDLIMICVQY